MADCWLVLAICQVLGKSDPVGPCRLTWDVLVCLGNLVGTVLQPPSLKLYPELESACPQTGLGPDLEGGLGGSLADTT